MITANVSDRDAVDLWFVPRLATAAATAAMRDLDRQERKRAGRFRRVEDRNLYVTAHAALRRILAAQLDCPPASVPLLRAACHSCGGPHGRPVLAARHAPLHFSLSHSRQWCLIGTSVQELGVDIVATPSAPRVQACLSRLHPGEQCELRDSPDAQRPQRFAQVWARKEAYLKAIGTGLTRSAGADYLGDSTDVFARRPRGVHVQDVAHRPGYAAAVALSQPRGSERLEPQRPARLRVHSLEHGERPMGPG